MKRFLSTILVFIFLTVPMACQDELRDRYQSPDTIAKPTLGEFMTAMINNNRVRPSYWEISTFVNWHIGVYSQTVGYLNKISMYQQNESYIQDRWDDYYRPGPNGAGVMANFREIEKYYAVLSTDDKIENEVFIQVGRVVLCEQTAQMVDLWGDIPFSEAGALNSTGKIVYAKFDSSDEIYSALLDNLKGASDYFSSASLTQSVQAQFTKQDVLLGGDLEKWRRYTNSLRLRFLMRLSYVQEDKSKEEVFQLLNNQSQYPLLNSDGYSPGEDDILLKPLPTYSEDLHDAFTDWTNYPAPYFALEEVLKPANDLRIPVLYDKYGSTINGVFIPNAEFNALPLTITSIEQQENIEHYAILDSATFLYNPKLPGVVFTASEINFLKAEAFERWGGGDALAEYFKGIKNSIKFYFYLNNLNTIKENPLPIPADGFIDDFMANSLPLEYTGTMSEKLSKVWTQKWIHFCFLQSIQAWAEKRRTGFPQLSFSPSSRDGFELPPERLTYPGNEKTYNENYATVATRDLRSTKIFWSVK